MKKEASSDKEDSKVKVKKEKKDSKEKPIKKEVPERRKLSIVIKDLKRTELAKPSIFKSISRDKEREREKEKDKRQRSREHDRSRDKKSAADVSDVSLSDEETYRKMLEYHTSSRWVDPRSNHVRDWDRDKRRRSREEER